MSDNSTDPEAAGAKQVPFAGGWVGLLFVLMVPCAVIFGIAAFNPEFAETLLEGRNRRRIFGAYRIGSVDVGALLLGGFATWEAVKATRRLINMRAVWIEGDIIRFHPTIRQRALPLRALESIQHEAGDIKSTLWLQHDGGKRIKVAMVDHDAACSFTIDAELAKAALPFA